MDSRCKNIYVQPLLDTLEHSIIFHMESNDEAFLERLSDVFGENPNQETVHEKLHDILTSPSYHYNGIDSDIKVTVSHDMFNNIKLLNIFLTDVSERLSVLINVTICGVQYKYLPKVCLPEDRPYYGEINLLCDGQIFAPEQTDDDKMLELILSTIPADQLEDLDNFVQIVANNFEI